MLKQELLMRIQQLNKNLKSGSIIIRFKRMFRGDFSYIPKSSEKKNAIIKVKIKTKNSYTVMIRIKNKNILYNDNKNKIK